MQIIWRNTKINKQKKKKKKKKKGENVPTIEIVEVVLVQCNSVEININKSLKDYILLCQINFMLNC